MDSQPLQEEPTAATAAAAGAEPAGAPPAVVSATNLIFLHVVPPHWRRLLTYRQALACSRIELSFSLVARSDAAASGSGTVRR
jgi:hypothetical protein